MPADSLLELATRACGRIHKRITDIGHLRYDLVRRILMKIENPEQLYQIEQNCPQIVGHDAELWLNLIKRDVPNYLTKPHEPRNPENWFKVYKKLKKEAEQEMLAGEAKLKAELDELKALREASSTEVKDWRYMPQLSHSENFDQKRPFQAGKLDPREAGVAYLSPAGKVKAERVTAKAKPTLMDKIRKEERANKANREAKLLQMHSKPGKTMTRVSAIPPGFLEDAKKAERAKQLAEKDKLLAERVKLSNSKSPEKSPGALNQSTKPSQARQSIREREERLRALKTGNSATSSAPKSIVDLDDELFGVKTTTKSSSSSLIDDADLPEPQSRPSSRCSMSSQGSIGGHGMPPQVRVPGRHGSNASAGATPQPVRVVKRKAEVSCFFSKPKRARQG